VDVSIILMLLLYLCIEISYY